MGNRKQAGLAGSLPSGQPPAHHSRWKGWTELLLVSMHDYEALHYDKEQLKEASVPLGTVVVPGDSDLELCRAHIERLQREPDGAGAKSPMCHQLSSKWCFLDATTASRFYRIDRAQVTVSGDHHSAQRHRGFPEQLRIQVSRVSMHDYEALHYDKEQLKEASVPLGTVVVPGDSDLELCRAHIERLQREPDGAGAKSPMCHQLSSKWCFLDATTASRFYRIDRAQEHLNYVTEIAQDEIYILDPELLGASARPDLPTPTSPLPASPCSPTPGSMQGDTALPQGEELIEAAKRNDCCKLQELHRAGGDLMHRDQKSRTLLHHAVSTGSKEVVRYLLDHAPPEILDAVEENGETCLHQAAALGQRTICHYIVEAGASLMKTDLQGDTPRQRAEKAQDTELAAYLENRQHYQMIQREDQETAV